MSPNTGCMLPTTRQKDTKTRGTIRPRSRQEEHRKTNRKTNTDKEQEEDNGARQDKDQGMKKHSKTKRKATTR